MDLSFLFRKYAQQHRLPPSLHGHHMTRVDACDFCHETKAVGLARMDFWDLSEHTLVQCPNCHLMQLDPMLTHHDLSTGCEAYFELELSHRSSQELARNYFRNFRKGVSLGMELKALGFLPHRSLDVGAGDGYFSKGLQFVFPELQVFCLDAVPEVRARIERQFGFNTADVDPESMTPQTTGGTFDLVIARDIIEHVRSPSTVLKRTYDLLKPKGYFHFMTPNGYEDIWFSHTQWKLNQMPVELLINHVSFFPALTLRAKLEEIGFHMKRWISFDFKGTFREKKGQRFDPRLAANPSTKRSAKQTLVDLRMRSKTQHDKDLKAFEPDPDEIIKAPILRIPTLAQHIYYFRYRPGLRCDADIGIGHELYGLAQR